MHIMFHVCLFLQPHLSHWVITSRITLSPFVVFFCNIMLKMTGLKIFNSFTDLSHQYISVQKKKTVWF